jgi:hypothetical protein
VLLINADIETDVRRADRREIKTLQVADKSAVLTPIWLEIQG